MKKIRQTLCCLVIVLLPFSCTPSKTVYVRNEGMIFGTTYHLIYQSKEDLHSQIKLKYNEFDLSLSTYNKESVISKVNKNVPVEADAYFLKLFNTAQKISAQTNGAFDMTVAALVNAWGFGFTNKDSISDQLIDSLRQYIGMDKVWLEGKQVRKANEAVMLDASAIAKGYAVDVIADFLETKEIDNYMVEIGGEIRMKGKNHKGVAWRVGIDKPIDDPKVLKRDLQAIISIDNGALATSGNYRNFYYENGRKYAHTIDPATGYPVQHELLSASVIAKDCMTADAYATAFMVMGLEKSKALVESTPGLEAYFIASTGEEEYEIVYTKGFEKLLSNQ
ncbi:FAD:protein FMN transferase [Marinilabiliaceae bacterium JC017]|nr:FAD:protein FMN transferase [Marinilabiliaceae bacterium JC017]